MHFPITPFSSPECRTRCKSSKRTVCNFSDTFNLSWWKKNWEKYQQYLNILKAVCYCYHYKNVLETQIFPFKSGTKKLILKIVLSRSEKSMLLNINTYEQVETKPVKKVQTWIFPDPLLVWGCCLDTTYHPYLNFIKIVVSVFKIWTPKYNWYHKKLTKKLTLSN